MPGAVPRRSLPGRLPGSGAQNLLLRPAGQDGALLRAAALRVPVPPHAQLRPPRVPSPLLRRRLSAVQRGASSTVSESSFWT